MRLETAEPEEIKLNMTAMIDIVFQLLVFFIMTFKVVAMEGDFSIRMPLATETPMDQMIEDPPELIEVALRAGDNGNINSIVINNDQTYSDEQLYVSLTKYIEDAIAGEADPEAGVDTEVEFDIDYGLKYSYTVKAIEAVSGRVQADGSIKKLIEKIKFKDNSSQQ